MIEFLKFALPLIGAVIAWFFNEHRKRAWEEYQLKEANYKELILTLKGFYVLTNEPVTNEPERRILKTRFIDQLNLCWLYSPDFVISAGYQFMDTVRAGGESSPLRQEEALGFFILAIRKDLISRRITRKTKLKSKDYKIKVS